MQTPCGFSCQAACGSQQISFGVYQTPALKPAFEILELLLKAHPFVPGGCTACQLCASKCRDIMSKCPDKCKVTSPDCAHCPCKLFPTVLQIASGLRDILKAQTEKPAPASASCPGTCPASCQPSCPVTSGLAAQWTANPASGPWAAALRVLKTMLKARAGREQCQTCRESLEAEHPIIAECAKSCSLGKNASTCACVSFPRVHQIVDEVYKSMGPSCLDNWVAPDPFKSPIQQMVQCCPAMACGHSGAWAGCPSFRWFNPSAASHGTGGQCPFMPPIYHPALAVAEQLFKHHPTASSCAHCAETVSAIQKLLADCVKKCGDGDCAGTCPCVGLSSATSIMNSVRASYTSACPHPSQQPPAAVHGQAHAAGQAKNEH